MLTGSTGDFLHSLPIVMTAALVSSRLASMTFIPLLGYYLLRAPKKPEPTHRRAPHARILRLLLQTRRKRHPLALGRARRLARLSRIGRAWSPRNLKASFSPKTFSTGPTSMSGCPTMRRSPPRMKPRSESSPSCSE